MTGDGADPGRIVRPFALTGGRTRPVTDLALEALVVARPGANRRAATLGPDQREIVRRAARPVAVAEVSAHLDVPLGVARVLVADLAHDGLVDVHRPRADRPDRALLEKVLDGIRSL